MAEGQGGERGSSDEERMDPLTSGDRQIDSTPKTPSVACCQRRSPLVIQVQKDRASRRKWSKWTQT